MTDKIITEEGLESAPHGIVFIGKNGDEVYRRSRDIWVSVSRGLDECDLCTMPNRKSGLWPIANELPLTRMKGGDV